jgi:ribosome-associated protein
MPQLEFRLTGEFIALNNLLKVTGVCASGGAGAVELRKTCKIRAGQVVRVGDVQIRVLGNDPAQ